MTDLQENLEAAVVAADAAYDDAAYAAYAAAVVAYAEAIKN